MPTGDKWVQLWVAQDVSRCRGHLWACSAMQGWRTNMEVQHAVIDVFFFKFFQLVSVCGMVINLIVRVSIHIKIPKKNDAAP